MLSYLRRINFTKAYIRFTLASVLSLIVTALVCYLIYCSNCPIERQSLFIRLLIVGSFLFLSSIIIRLSTEAYLWKLRTSVIAWGIAIVLSILGFYYLPSNFDLFAVKLFRLPFYLSGLYLIFHLIISYIPFLKTNNNEDFWDYNRTVFFLFVESAFFSLFLFVTLSFALVALENLFDVKVDFKIYQYLGALLAGVFHSLYFLSKYPTLSYDRTLEKQSRVFSVFIQFILIPVSLIYAIILHAYAIKIGLNGELPKGWVSQLSLWFSVIGIFTFLLNYFAERISDKPWAIWYKKYFVIFLIVPTILLIISTYKRINDYGVTEPRYVLVIISVWLLALIIALGSYKKMALKWIPISLSVFIAFAVFSGPLSMFEMTKRSQIERTKEILIKNGWMIGDVIKPQDGSTKRQDAILSEQLSFMERRTNLEFFNEWLETPLQFKSISKNSDIDSTNAAILAAYMNLDYNNYSYVGSSEEYFSYYTDQMLDMDISEYNELIEFNINSTRFAQDAPSDQSIWIAGTDIFIRTVDGEMPIDVREKLDRLSPTDNYSLSAENLSTLVTVKNTTYKIFFKSINGYKTTEMNYHIESAAGLLLIDQP